MTTRKQRTPEGKAEMERQTTQAAEKAPEGARILELFVENIKRVRVAHIKPKGDVIQVTGRNGEGKSSVLDAIAWALTGTSTVPTQPIRKGQRTGTIKMDLGEFVVFRHFTAVDPTKSEKGHHYITKLVVEGKRREQFPQPQALLNALMGKISFDPLAFIRMDDKTQIETLRQLVKFDVDIDALDQAQKDDYEDRREAGRHLDKLKARMGAMQAPEPGLPEQPIDVEELTQQLDDAYRKNRQIAEAQRRKEDIEKELQSAKDKARDIRFEVQKLIDEARSLDGLQASLMIPAGRTRPNRVDDLLAESAKIIIEEPVSIASISERLKTANATNERIRFAAAHRSMTKQIEEAQAAWKEIDDRMKQRAGQREEVIAKAKMPVEGLSLGDGEILFEGLPFSQASSAKKIEVSMALGMASNPKLRVLRIMDGSLLDDTSLEQIGATATKNGYQVWIERVDSSGKIGVVMEDGEASGEEVVVKEAK